MKKTASEVLQEAKAKGFALGAFNAGNLEIVRAVVQAAQAQKAAVIIEVSSGEAAHFGMKNFLAVVENFRQETGLPLLTNFDHGPGLEECQQAIEAGFNLVHFDGSSLPYLENVKITQALVALARPKGVLIEAEIDKIVNKSQAYEENPESIQAAANYTDPQKAAEFVQTTGCDLLAVFVGNLHGVYQEPVKLDLERMAMISQGANCFFSLHGGSGLESKDIQAVIKTGVVKVNVNTELRLAYKETLQNVLRGSEEVAIYKIMPPVIAAVQKVVEEKIQLFGAAPSGIVHV